MSWLEREDVEVVVAQIASGELDVPRDGTRLYVGIDVGCEPSSVVVYRDRGRRGISIAQEGGKVLARLQASVCRWCAGSGLHPHLPPRMRQVFTETRSVNVTKGVTNSTEQIVDPRTGATHLVAHVTPGTNIDFIGVGQARPLRAWWDICERKSPDYLAVLPPYDEVCCPRCLGEGF